MIETLSICRDEDCPECGWPETYAEGPASTGPTHIGCRNCGWRAGVYGVRRNERGAWCLYLGDRMISDHRLRDGAVAAYRAHTGTGPPPAKVTT